MVRLRASVAFAAVLAAGCHAVVPQPPPPEFIYPGVPAVAPRPAPEPPPVTEPAAAGVLDLDVALRLAGVDNPTIALAREVVHEAVAGQLAARSLLLPSVNVGGNFRYHDGPLLTAGGVVLDVQLRGAYLGLGAGAVGTGALANPGVRLFADLGEAAYAPLAARQRVAARRSDAAAVRNAVLLDVAAAYLDLVGAEGRREVLRRGGADVAEVVRLTAAYAAAGQGRQADAKRAEATAELVRRDLGRAEEEVGAASARLARLLNLDPAALLRTPGGPVRAVRLVPEDTEPETLVAEALRARPEVAAGAAAVAEARTRARQERARPWLPTLTVGYSYGGFGGGGDLGPDPFAPLRGRSDVSAAAVWTAQNLGGGNRARVRGADAAVGAAAADLDRVVNQVRREVAEAAADARAAAEQSATAAAALADAEEGFRLEAERIRQGQGRPIEALDSFRQLLESRQELLRATVAFSAAQFRLFVALGRAPGG
jgi:outer membrane protein TolC